MQKQYIFKEVKQTYVLAFNSPFEANTGGKKCPAPKEETCKLEIKTIFFLFLGLEANVM